MNVSRTWGMVLCALALAIVSARGVLAQASVQGQWQTLPYPMPINPVHLAVTSDGKVLIVSG